MADMLAAMETLIKKLVNFKSGEGKALFWSFAYFFFLLSTYYMLLPIRDAFGIRGGAAGPALAVPRHVHRRRCSRRRCRPASRPSCRASVSCR